MKAIWLLLLVIITLIATGCSVAIPVHEAEPPEVLDNWGFRIGVLDGGSPQIAPKDTGVISSDPSAETLPLAGYRLDFGFLERFQLDWDLYLNAFAGGGTSVALKYQWIGDTYFKAKAGNYSQTTTVRFWSGAADDVSLNFNGSNAQSNHSTVKGNGEDVSHIFGYRPADFFGVYGGPKLIFGHVEADFQNDTNGPVLATGGRDFWGGGGLAGMFLSPHGEHIGFDFVLEYQLMNLPQTYSDSRGWYSTFMLMAALPFSFN